MKLTNSQIALLDIAYKCLDTLTDEIPVKTDEDGVKELWQSFEIIADLRDYAEIKID